MMVTIWDGLKFREVDRVTANKLVAEDKAEIPTGSAVKYRSQFTGYQNRAMATQINKAETIQEPEQPKRKRGRPSKKFN